MDLLVCTLMYIFTYNLRIGPQPLSTQNIVCIFRCSMTKYVIFCVYTVLSPTNKSCNTIYGSDMLHLRNLHLKLHKLTFGMSKQLLALSMHA